MESFYGDYFNSACITLQNLKCQATARQLDLAATQHRYDRKCPLLLAYRQLFFELWTQSHVLLVLISDVSYQGMLYSSII